MKTLGLIVTTAFGLCAAMTGTAHAQYNWGGFWYEPGPYIPPTPVIPPIVIPIPNPGPTIPDAGETRLQIGIPNRTPFAKVQGVDLLTSDVDDFLANRTVVSFAGVTLDPDFGDHFSRDLANLGFEKLRNLESKLEVAITKEVAESADVVVAGYYTDLEISPFNLNFAQVGRFLDIRAGDVKAEFVGKVKADFCGNVKGRVYLSNINAYTRLDLGNGVAVDTGSDIRVDDVEISSGNPLKWLCIRVGDIFIDKNKAVRNGIQDAVDDAINLVEAEKILGVNDILITSGAFIEANRSSIAAISAQQDRALMAIRQAYTTINDENFAGSGVEIDFKYDDAQNNLVSLIARHGTVEISHLEYGKSNVFVNLKLPPNTKRSFIYAQYTAGGRWYNVGTVYGSSGMIGQMDFGTRLVAIGENQAISGLYGEAGRPVQTNWDFNCQYTGGTCPSLY